MTIKKLSVQTLFFALFLVNGVYPSAGPSSLSQGILLSDAEANDLRRSLGLIGEYQEIEQPSSQTEEVSPLLQSTMFSDKEMLDIHEALRTSHQETQNLMNRSIGAEADIAQIKKAHAQEKKEGQGLSGRLAEKKKELALQLLLWEKLIADMDKKIDELIDLRDTTLQQARQKQSRLLRQGKSSEAQKARFIDEEITQSLAEQAKQLKQRRDELEIKLTELKKEIAGILKKEILSERRAKRRAQEELAKKIKLEEENKLNDIIEEFEDISEKPSSGDLADEFEELEITIPEETSHKRKGWYRFW